jgi:hypothetical protein
LGKKGRCGYFGNMIMLKVSWRCSIVELPEVGKKVKKGDKIG